MIHSFILIVTECWSVDCLSTESEMKTETRNKRDDRDRGVEVKEMLIN